MGQKLEISGFDDDWFTELPGETRKRGPGTISDFGRMGCLGSDSVTGSATWMGNCRLLRAGCGEVYRPCSAMAVETTALSQIPGRRERMTERPLDLSPR